MQLSSKADDNELVMQTRQKFIMNTSRCAVEEYRDEFHMTKIALHCAGIYFKGSGIDIALILSKCFGKNTIDSVLSVGHYVRSLLGMQVIKEAFEVMVWEAFWESSGSPELKAIEELKGRVQ